MPDRCTRCGYMLARLRRVMLMVDGRAMNEHVLCPDCLAAVFDALQLPTKRSA